MEEFLKEFYKSLFTPEKKHYFEVQLTKFPEVNLHYRTLVKQSHKVSHEDFWQRYEFRCTNVRRIMRQIMAQDEAEAAAAAQKQQQAMQAKEEQKSKQNSRSNHFDAVMKKSKNSEPNLVSEEQPGTSPPPGSSPGGMLSNLRERIRSSIEETSSITPIDTDVGNGSALVSVPESPGEPATPVTLTDRFNSLFSPTSTTTTEDTLTRASATKPTSHKKVDPNSKAKNASNNKGIQEDGGAKRDGMFSGFFSRSAKDTEVTQNSKRATDEQTKTAHDQFENTLASKLTKFVVITLLVISLAVASQEPSIACSALPPGSLLREELHFSGPRKFEAPWWIPTGGMKSLAFQTLCSGYPQTELEWSSSSKLGKDGRKRFDVRLSYSNGAKVIFHETNIQSLRVSWDTIDISKAGSKKPSNIQAPWKKKQLN